jgi:hypothetical protein
LIWFQRGLAKPQQWFPMVGIKVTAQISVVDCFTNVLRVTSSPESRNVSAIRTDTGCRKNYRHVCVSTSIPSSCSVVVWQPMTIFDCTAFKPLITMNTPFVPIGHVHKNWVYRCRLNEQLSFWSCEIRIQVPTRLVALTRSVHVFSCRICSSSGTMYL